MKELAEYSSTKIAYYSKGLSNENYQSLCKVGFAGYGCDSSIDLKNLLISQNEKFIQGNFDEKNMLMNKKDFIKKLDIYCDNILTLSSKERAGWICGLGHGINKDTSEDHVHIFIETIRKKFK